jgi:BTB/POZ domain
LKLASDYFRKLFYSVSDNADDVIDLPSHEVDPWVFDHVLQFIYAGEANLNTTTVGGVARAAHNLGVAKLRTACIDLMQATATPETCLSYWSHLEDIDWSIAAEQKLVRTCRELARRTAFATTSANSGILAGANDVVIEALLRDDYLQVTGFTIDNWVE